MISDKKKKVLAQRARKKLRKRAPATRKEASHVKIQLWAPWQRLLVAGLSFVCLVLSIHFYESSLLLASIFGLLFVICLIIAIIGRRKTIDSIIDGLDFPGEIVSSIFDGLF